MTLLVCSLSNFLLSKYSTAGTVRGEITLVELYSYEKIKSSIVCPKQVPDRNSNNIPVSIIISGPKDVLKVRVS